MSSRVSPIRQLFGGDIGETFYVVDGDYRTIAQGWSQADGTGPLDIYGERNRNRVFYTNGANGGPYATDAAAMQGAIDAAVDFRGDKVFLTPGSYAPAAVVALDCAGIRLLGPQGRHVKSALVTVTAGIDAAYTVSVDDVEIGNHTMVPLTAKNFIDISSGADRGHLHDLYYNAAGITGSTSTEFVNGAASVDWLVERCSFYVDAAQGDAFTLASPERWVWQDSDFLVGLSAVAWASVFTFTTSALGNIARRLYFRGAGGATAAVFTNIFTGIANVNGQLMISDCRVDGTALSTAGDIETTFGTTTDIELVETYLSGDATTEGGALVKLT
jgi:hypothetical protein